MAIIYSYPISTNLTGKDLLVLTDPDTTGKPTKTVTLSTLTAFLNGQPQGGTGTTNNIIRFTDGAGGLIGDSILAQNALATSVAVDGDLTFADNKKILLGNSSDLQLYHDNTDSRIINSTGDLIVDTGTLRVRNAAGAKTVIVANSTSVELYHNDVKKLETTSAGITVTGNLVVSGTVTGTGGSFLPLTGGTMTGNLDLGDNDYIRLGNGQDLQIYHNVVGNDSIIQESGAGDLQIYSNTELKIASGVLGETYAKFTLNGPIELYYDNNKKFSTTANGINVPPTTSPSSATDTGTAGDIRITTNYIYVCTATNTWKRAALSTF